MSTVQTNYFRMEAFHEVTRNGPILKKDEMRRGNDMKYSYLWNNP